MGNRQRVGPGRGSAQYAALRSGQGVRARMQTAQGGRGAIWTEPLISPAVALVLILQGKLSLCFRGCFDL